MLAHLHLDNVGLSASTSVRSRSLSDETQCLTPIFSAVICWLIYVNSCVLSRGRAKEQINRAEGRAGDRVGEEEGEDEEEEEKGEAPERD